jgi:uncharacterized protein (TIGR03437 family)
VQAQVGYEADVTPRPTGKNGAITAADYQQIGRFATGLETVSTGYEWQRADCAPRATLGDGRIGMGDVVQAMRYSSGLDPLTPTGGPLAAAAIATPPVMPQVEAAREVRVGTPAFGVGTMTNLVAELGVDAAGGLLLLNTKPLASGRVGVGIALPPGQALPAGTRQVLRVTFSFALTAVGQTTPIGFASSPVMLEVADVLGEQLEQRIFTGKSITLEIPAPKITALQPGFILRNSPAFHLEVTGMNFVPGAVVNWDKQELATTYSSASLLVAAVPAQLLTSAYPVPITVTTPMPGRRVSNPVSFEVRNPPPGEIRLGRDTIAAGSVAGTLSLTGSNFVPGAVVAWNGRPLPTRFVSPTQLQADYVAADLTCAGSVQITAVNPLPGGGTSPPQTLRITPTITSLSPAFAAVGGNQVLLTVTGTGFCAGASIRVNGVARASTVLSPTQISTILQAADLTAPATLQIAVGVNESIVSTPIPLTVCLSGPPKITMDNVLDFGLATPAREPLANRPTRTFTVENTGCQAVTISFATRRTGEDVISGKITNPDDSGTFVLYNITAGANQELRSGTSLTIEGFGARTLRIVFDPKIPTPAGGTTNLAASQVIPDVITTSFSVLQGATTLKTVTLTGQVEANARLINPLAPRLAPLVVFNKTGNNEFTVEASGYDANANLYLVSYQFYDQAGNRVGQAPNFNLDLRQVGLLKGQSFTLIKKFSVTESGLSAHRVQVYFYDREDYAFATSGPINTGQGRILNATTVSAASFQSEAVAVDSIVSVFSENFGAPTVAAQGATLPTELGETRVYVTDANQVERPARLFFVSPSQINYLIPEGTLPGEARVVVVNKEQVVSEGRMRVAAMAPSLFTANADGKGVPAGYVVRVKPDQSQVTEPVARYDTLQKKFIPTPIQLGPAEEQVFLVLFGTGIRHYGAMNRVSARIAGVEAEVHYAGQQGQYYGLDQVNLRIPRSLLVGGEVDLQLTIDGKPANPVRLHIQ